jgi:hypothetical protein
MHVQPSRLNQSATMSAQCGALRRNAALRCASPSNMQNEPNCQNDSCEGRSLSHRVAAASSRRLRRASETPRGRGGYAGGNRRVQRFAAQCSAFQHVEEEMQNEANVNLVNFSRAWSGIRS